MQNTVQNFSHAVLAVATDNGPVMMDNLHRQTITAANVPEYTPLYSVNADSIWTHNSIIAGL